MITYNIDRFCLSIYTSDNSEKREKYSSNRNFLLNICLCVVVSFAQYIFTAYSNEILLFLLCIWFHKKDTKMLHPCFY